MQKVNTAPTFSALAIYRYDVLTISGYNQILPPDSVNVNNFLIEFT